MRDAVGVEVADRRSALGGGCVGRGRQRDVTGDTEHQLCDFMIPFKTRQILLEVTLKAPTKASRTLRLTQPSL